MTICLPKDKIFAYLNLDEKELVLYEKLYAMLKSSAPVPDLVIYLQADVHTLIHRIRQRGKQYEQKMSIEYLEELIKAYNHFFSIITNLHCLL